MDVRQDKDQWMSRLDHDPVRTPAWPTAILTISILSLLLVLAFGII